jgi:hypothetical protein
MARYCQESIGLFAQGHLQIGADDKLVRFDGTVDIPGLSPLRYHELILSTRLYPAFFLLRCRLECRAAGVVVNTWYDLEAEVIEAMRRGRPEFEESNVCHLVAGRFQLRFAS